MATITAHTLILPLLVPVKPNGRVKSKGPVQCRLPFGGGRRQIVLAQSGPVGLCGQFLPIDKRRPITHSSRMQSASMICAAAAAAKCSAESQSQTQTITRKAPTITHLPGKEKGPQLADGGGGFPPRDDGGGGGGGGGGENFSGGFFLFGILAFLGFLKELDDDKKRKRR